MRRVGLAVLVVALVAGGCSFPHPKNSHGVTKVAATEAEAEQINDR
jgi:hypothetical protein